MNRNRKYTDINIIQERWSELAKLTKIKENKIVNETLQTFVKGKDGRAYGIVSEGNKYYVKVATGNKENYDVSDFAYIGGFENKLNEKFDSFEQASKRLNIKMISINEKYNRLDEMVNEKGYVKEDEEELLNQLETATSETPEVETPTDAPSEEAPVETPIDAPVDIIDIVEPTATEPMPDSAPTEAPVMDAPAETPSEEAPVENPEAEAPATDSDNETYSEIQKLLGKLSNEFTQMGDVSPTQAKTALNTVISATKQGISAMSDEEKMALQKRIEKGGEKIEEGEDLIDEGVWDGIKGVFNKGKEDAKAFGADVKDVANKVSGAVKDAVDDVKKVGSEYKQAYTDASNRADLEKAKKDLLDLQRTAKELNRKIMSLGGNRTKILNIGEAEDVMTEGEDNNAMVSTNSFEKFMGDMGYNYNENTQLVDAIVQFSKGFDSSENDGDFDMVASYVTPEVYDAIKNQVSENFLAKLIEFLPEEIYMNDESSMNNMTVEQLAESFGVSVDEIKNLTVKIVKEETDKRKKNMINESVKKSLIKEAIEDYDDEDEFLSSPEYFVDTYINGNFKNLKSMLADFVVNGRVKELMLYINDNAEPKINDWIIANLDEVIALTESKMTKKGSDFMSKEISHLIKDKGYGQKRAVAAAYNIAKDKGYKTPEKGK